MDLSITVGGAKQVVANFDSKGKKARNLRPAMSRIGDMMKKSFDLNYSSRGSRFGAKWATRRKSYPWPILEKTGAMRRGFRSDVGGDYVKLTNLVKHFPFHQRGTRRLPKRAMLGYATADINDAVREIRRHLELGA
jgi:phage gpG-like protein